MRTGFFAFLLFSFCLAAAPASAATKTWTGANSSDWYDGGNWAGGVPNGADTAVMDNNTATLINGGVATANTTVVGGPLGAGDLTISGGGVLNSSLTVGGQSGTGTTLVTGAGSTLASGYLAYGVSGGTGTLNVENGGVVTVGGGNAAVFGVTAVGVLNVSGGTFSVTGHNVYAGYTAGNGAINITNGGVVTALNAVLSHDNGSTSELLISGAGSRLTVSSTVFIGLNGGSGEVTLTDGGALQAASFNIANGNGRVGTLNIGAAAGDAAAAAGVLTLGSNSFSTTAGGTATVNFNHTNAGYVFNDAMGGNITMRHYAGDTTLSGNSTYTGATVMEGGTLAVSGALGATAVTVNDGDMTVSGNGGSGTLTVNGGSYTLTGTRGNGTIVLNDGDITIGAAATSGTGIVTVNGGTMTVGGTSNASAANINSGGTLVVDGSLAGTATVAAGGLAGGTGTFSGNIVNAGDMAPGVALGAGVYGDMTIGGDYNGQAGSRLLLNVALAGNASPADTVVFDGGAVTGTTQISVTNTGGTGGGTTGDGIRIISAVNGATIAANTFTLAAPVAVGIYTYDLFQGDAAGLTPDDIFLRSSGIVAAVAGTGASPALAVGYINNMMSMMKDYGQDLADDVDVVSRLKLGFGGGLDSMDLAEGAWLRVFGGQADVENDDAANSAYDGSFQGVQMGKDIWRHHHDGGHKTRAGIYLAQGFAQADLSSDAGNAGESDMNATSGGVYAVHHRDGGAYAAAAVQYNRVHGLKVSQNTGRALDTPGNGVSASVEAGKSVKAGKRVIIEPSAQAIYQMLKFRDVNDGVADVSFKTVSTATGRAGARVKYIHESQDGLIVEPWGQVNIFHTLDTDSELTFDGTDTFVSPLGGTRGEVQLGLTIGRGRADDGTAWNAYASAGYQHGLSGSELSAWTVGAGVRFNW